MSVWDQVIGRTAGMLGNSIDMVGPPLIVPTSAQRNRSFLSALDGPLIVPTSAQRDGSFLAALNDGGLFSVPTSAQHGDFVPQVVVPTKSQRAAQQAGPPLPPKNGTNVTRNTSDQTTPDQDKFIQNMLPTAQKWSEQTGIPVEYLIAANISESNWGQAPGNELFGIKATSGHASQDMNSWEYGQGNTNSGFNTYASPDEAYADFVTLISTTPRYAAAWSQFQQDRDPDALFRNLNTAGYATDPLWGSKISGLAKGTVQPKINRSSLEAKYLPFLGDSYHWGGKSPATGFDCSGLAGYLTTGKAESTRTLYAKSKAVSADQAQPGDLVFYHMASSGGPDDEHVAVYIGNGRIVQSGGRQHNVNVDLANQFSDPGWEPEVRRLVSM
jgi:flagellum-specific peptidoglycan hydrolase FlgJ